MKNAMQFGVVLLSQKEVEQFQGGTDGKTQMDVAKGIIVCRMPVPIPIGTSFGN